jgi:glycosyltransferase involved in cell wall biosynthesis
MPYLYRQSLALVMPSYFGPTNLPPLEAFALGVPVLYPDKAGLREQVGAAALLMDLRDPDSLATHLNDLLSQPELRHRLVTDGHNRLIELDALDRIKILERILRDFHARRATWR